MSKLVHQLLVVYSNDECPNDIQVGDIGELGALLRKAPNELLESLVRLLSTTPKIPRVARVQVSALEVPHEDFN